MKKKVLFIVLASFMITGVVSAASLWGSYNGKPIIRLTVEGVPVKVSDAPAVLMDDRTMVPIYLLKEAGIEYSWDGKNQTVDIKKAKPTVQTETVSKEFDPVQKTIDIMNYGGGGVTLTNIAGELTAITYYQATSGFDVDWPNIDQIFRNLVDFNAKYSQVVYLFNGTENTIEIITQNYKDYLSGIITDAQLSKLWILSGSLFDGTTGTSSGSNYTDTNNGTAFDTINSKIDGDFEGFEDGKIFKLQNGQIWEQTSFDYKYSYKYSPDVTIYKDGSIYYMIVDGVDKKVKVKQIK